MLENRDLVLGVMQRIRKNPERFYIPLGGYDISTPLKKDLSYATGSLYNNVPIVKSIVEACRHLPIYVGYTGHASEQTQAVYRANIISLHRGAQDEDCVFARVYPHELTHLDQDRRGLLGPDTPPRPERLCDYVVHIAYLEAAAYATEVTSLMYLSHHSHIGQTSDRVAAYFSEYLDESGDEDVFIAMAEAQRSQKIVRFEGMKPAWQAAFQHFFHPDSGKLAGYVQTACEDYIKKIIELHGTHYKVEKYDWSSIEKLRAITTLPGWGPMFDENVLPFIARQARASTLQNRHLERIGWTVDQAKILTHKPRSEEPRIRFG